MTDVEKQIKKETDTIKEKCLSFKKDLKKTNYDLSDLVAVTLTKYLKELQNGELIKDVGGWAYRVASNQTIDWAREYERESKKLQNIKRSENEQSVKSKENEADYNVDDMLDKIGDYVNLYFQSPKKDIWFLYQQSLDWAAIKAELENNNLGDLNTDTIRKYYKEVSENVRNHLNIVRTTYEYQATEANWPQVREILRIPKDNIIEARIREAKLLGKSFSTIGLFLNALDNIEGIEVPRFDADKVRPLLRIKINKGNQDFRTLLVYLILFLLHY